MTIKELAIELNVDIGMIFSFLDFNKIDFQNDEDFVLTDEICNNARISKHNSINNKNNKKEHGQSENIVPEVSFLPANEQTFIKSNTNNETNKYQKVDVNNFINEQYYSYPEKQLITEILIKNQIDKLLLVGTYSPDKQGRNFGFFDNITHFDGKNLIYPQTNKRIDSLIVLTTKLDKGKKYTFEAQVAKIEVRKQHKNPFLLQAKTKNINEIIKLSELETLIEQKEKEFDISIRNKQIELDNITHYLLDSENLKQQKVTEIEQEIETQKNIKLQEANQLIEEFNNSLISLQENINTENSRLGKLTFQVNSEQETLSNLNKQRTEMETTINFLRNKIEICKNLEFLSDEDANKYFNILSSEFRFQTSDYLDFETDFNSNYFQLATHIQHYLYHKKNLIYTDFQIKNFLTLLLTNDLIVLSGLSGSGKTQIVKSFAEALGGVAKIIPVKPNWTSSDDLLGYFNPIQSSYLPTPFTEAIVEAILNPHQIYLICLDEMNLARAEYYFADFLSGLEERTKLPEIDLYAKHEEELFISEFKTLLTLVESSIGATKINSWNEFLENDKIRNRFFEILGNVEQDTMLQIHSKMKKRLIDILKFPSSIKIPNNVRFIGAINVDETTHYFSPKILDRVHIVKFENPLLIEDTVNYYMENSSYEKELKPVYFNPLHLGVRQELPSISNSDYTEVVSTLKEINKNYLLPLSIDFGVRSIRQAINYVMQFTKVAANETEGDFYKNSTIALNSIIMQKILPRFIFDNRSIGNSKSKVDILKEFKDYLKNCNEILRDEDEKTDFYFTGLLSDVYVNEMEKQLDRDGQVNFWSISSTLNITEIQNIKIKKSTNEEDLPF